MAKEILIGLFTAIIDDEDYNLIKKYSWHAIIGKWGNIYAVTTLGKRPNRKHIKMEHLIFQSNKLIDHINNNSLDNRKENLRECTNQQNAFNTKKQIGTSSKYKGVTWDKSRNKWAAYIKYCYNRINLGRFDIEEEAGKAYDKKAKELFGEFARLNFS